MRLVLESPTGTVTDVYLNGMKVERAVEADDTAGYVLQICDNVEVEGSPIFRYGHRWCRRLEGEVEFRAFNTDSDSDQAVPVVARRLTLEDAKRWFDGNVFERRPAQRVKVADVVIGLLLSEIERLEKEVADGRLHSG